MTIELKQLDNLGHFLKITDVYVMTESANGYFIVVERYNDVSQIMKDSVHALIFQK